MELISKEVMLGTKLRNRYYIYKELGVGGFGQTFLAQDYDFPGQPLCVVKQLKPQVKEPWMLQTARRLFDLEASVLARIGNHPQIPQLKAHFEEDEQFYLVQDYIEGNLLSEELKPNQTWPQEMAIVFLQDILHVLKFIHDNQVIHRDLKPENIIRRHRDNKLVLIDFGSVKKITTLQEEDEDNSEFTVVIGTPAYMPAEQQGGKPTYNSDIYALGKIVIQGLSGVPPKRLAEDPHTGELLWEHLVKVDDSFAAILSRMVKWDARYRYQNVDEIINDLSPYLKPKRSSFKSSASSGNNSSSDLIQKIASNFKQHPEITRIKKLLFCAYKKRWENSSRVLIKYRTKFLVQELYERESTIKDFQQAMNAVVETLNKKQKYQMLADFIVDQVKCLYQSSEALMTHNKETETTGSKFTAIKGSDPHEINSAPIDTKLKKIPEPDHLALSTQSQVESYTSDEALELEESLSEEVYKATQQAEESDYSMFDLRYEITRYTTPLRIKILLFSTLYYKISFHEQDWSLMMSHQLDSLIQQLIKMFPTLPELETRLYATAKTFDDQEGLTQTVGAVLQSLRPFYEAKQLRFEH